ncbi:MAG: DNA topoisomerase, partial [Verrucomicrobiae bacterium]
PTLAILAEREEKIRAFQPRPYYEVHADFGVQAGTYHGRWFTEGFKKNGGEDAKAERIWERTAADAIVAKCQGRRGVVVEEKKPTTQIAPQLYDLTTLQREANGRFGLSAKRTLQIAQALYEKHKVLTYPRTDSRYMPEDNLANVKAAMTKLEEPDLAAHARKALTQGWVRPNKRIFNNAKVTDHHAIIPTGVSAKSLDDFEYKIYDMVARRFVAAFFPAAQFEVTTRITRVEGEAFKTEGKIITDPGWLAVYGKEAAGGDEAGVCAIIPGEPARTEAIEVRENETKPPPRFNEATLLSAMEGAGKLVDDEELREAMSQRGLGTPATRAQIIEGLILDGYLARQGRDLITTSKGLALITLLRGLGVQALTSPEMTGEWEHKLKRMECGGMPRPQFMEEIRAFTTDIVDKAKNFSGETVEGNFQPLDVECPKCGHSGFVESFKAFECGAKCGAIIWKNMAGRQFERDEVRTLLEVGRTIELEGFRSKLGRPFKAVVKLGAATEFKQSFDFGDSDDPAHKLDFSTLPALGKCPLCDPGTIHDTGSAWQCSNTPACKFRMGKTLCQREVPREQVEKLIADGKTALIQRFISKKGRPFSAFLTLDKSTAKVGFEFEPRKPAAKKPARPRAS